jgi:hypothetical protein
MACADAELRTVDNKPGTALTMATELAATSAAWTNDFDCATETVLLSALLAEVHRRLDPTNPELAAQLDKGLRYHSATATKLETEVPVHQGMEQYSAGMEM